MNKNLITKNPFKVSPAITRRSRSKKGAMMIIVLASLSVMIGLVFYVLNLGNQIDHKVSSQNAADATVISGAGQMARSMNVIAMNNVTTARLIALSCVMDALPLAAEMTIAEETGENRLPQALQRWASRTNSFTPYERDNFFLKGIQEIYRQMNPNSSDPTHLELLYEMDRRFDNPGDELQTEGGYDVTETTAWNAGGSSRGKNWQAAIAMDEFSQSILDSAGLLAQTNAGTFGEQNATNASFILPMKPQLLGKRTKWFDYAPPLLDHIKYGATGVNRQLEASTNSSRLVERLVNAYQGDTASVARRLYVRGGSIPDFKFPYRLGPFARLYRWRDYWDQYDSDYARTYIERWGYTTFGPLRHMLRQIVNNFGAAGRHAGIIDTTRFAFHLQTLAQVKLAYMFGLDTLVFIQYSDQWITDYKQAYQYYLADLKRMQKLREFNIENKTQVPIRSNIMTTRYYRVHVKSTVPWKDLGNWLNPAAWQTQEPTDTFTPRRWWSWELSGIGPYGDPTSQPLHRWIKDRSGFGMVHNPMPFAQANALGHNKPNGQWMEMDSSGQAWYRVYTNRRVRFDRQLGLPERPIYDNKGNIVDYHYYTVYHMTWQVFGGIELRNEHLLSNPLAGASQSELPAPILFDTSQGDYMHEHFLGVRREHFTFLGIASKGARAKIWANKFRSGNPSGTITSLAQAEVFNNRSWDLWTQDWQTQLVPVTDWQEWIEQLAGAEPDLVDSGAQLNVDQLDKIRDYLERIDPDLADAFLNH